MWWFWFYELGVCRGCERGDAPSEQSGVVTQVIIAVAVIVMIAAALRK